MPADQRVVALRQPADELVRVGGLRGGDDLRVGRARPPVRDVLPDGAVDHQGVLQQHRDVFAQVGQGQFAQVDAVQPDGPALRVVEAQQQLGGRRLARPALPHQGDRLAGLGAEGHVEQRHPGRPGVAEPHPVEGHRSVGPAGAQRDRRIGHLRLLVEQFDDPLGGGRGGVEAVAEPRDPPDRAVQPAQQSDEDEEFAEAQPAVDEFPGAQPEHDQRADQLQHLHDRREQRPQPGRRHRRPEPRQALPAEAFLLPVLPVVRLHQRDVAQRLLGHRAHRAAAPPPLPRRRLHQRREAPRREPEHRRDHEGHRGEVPAQVEQHAQEDGQLGDVRDRVEHAREEEGLDRLDVRSQPRQDVAEPPPLEEAQRKALQVPEHVRAQGEQEALADPGRGRLVGEAQAPCHQRQPGVPERDRQEQPEPARHQHLVDDDLEQPDRGRVDHRPEQDEPQQQGQPAPTPAGVGPEPPEHPPQRDGRGRLDDRIHPAVAVTPVDGHQPPQRPHGTSPGPGTWPGP